MKEKEITYKIIGCAMKVHNTLENPDNPKIK
jgi:hypothetical protein